MAPHARELTDLPRHDVDVSFGAVFQAGHTAFVLYEVAAERDELESRIAVLRLHGCSLIDGDGPNDEALHNHPCHELGVRVYGFHEVVESPLVVERVRMAHRDGDVWESWVRERHHFVFAFKENTVDCIAEGYECVGTYPSVMEAHRIVVELLIAAMKAWVH